jgi:hypothetical protein
MSFCTIDCTVRDLLNADVTVSMLLRLALVVAAPTPVAKFDQKSTIEEMARYCSVEVLARLANRSETAASLTIKYMLKYNNKNVYAVMSALPPVQRSTNYHAAAKYGRIDVLRWLRTHKNRSQEENTVDCGWTHQTCAVAAKANRLNVLEWLRDVGTARLRGSRRLDSDLPSEYYTDAATERPDIVKCPWSAWVWIEAARKGHLRIIEWCTNSVLHGYHTCHIRDTMTLYLILFQQRTAVVDWAQGHFPDTSTAKRQATECTLMFIQSLNLENFPSAVRY